MPDDRESLDVDVALREGERPTLKTISRITGLAVATVSRALHDAPDIGEDTKRRVHEVARQVGYRPNRAGVRLRTGKTNVISLVLSTDHDVMNHTAKLIQSIVAALRETPYHMIVTPFFPGEDPMIPIRYIVETGSADGVIMNQIQPEDPRVAYLMQRNFPFATHGRSKWRDRHAYYDFDNERFAEIAVEALARRGRRHIVLIAPPPEHNYAADMMRGARAAAERFGIGLEILRGVTSDSAGIEVEDCVRARITTGHPVDAFICASTTSAMAAVAGAEQCGRVIGADLDIFSKEAIPFLRRFRAPILSVYEDVGSAGDFLARAVTRRISDPTAPPMQGLDIPVFDFAGLKDPSAPR